MFDINITGLDTIKDNIDNIENRLKNINKLSLDELFNTDFMHEYSNFDTIHELFNNRNLNIVTQEDFNNIPKEKLDTVATELTNFSSWDDMFTTATNQYIIKLMS
ncbi:hypothetical protein [Vallitalea guaymasensis]|uniref:hypothetical protein n=1 Tax=Vallitalea guaymasensis TaxID=1185412 RepID=UPI000DE267AB|nr:hypothetical protein [Vallitalea guaymasensis]